MKDFSMDLRVLQYFVTVYETGSLTAAAKRAYVAQPSISAAMRDLESELGVSLFRRHRKGVSATDAAERFYPLAKNLLADAESVRAFFTRQSRTRSVLRVNIIASLDMASGGRILKTLLERNPDTELRIVARGEKADIRLTSSGDLGRRDTFIPLWRDEYIAAIPQASALAAQPSVQLDDLLAHPLIERSNCELHAQMMTLIAPYAHDARIVAKVDSEEWALALVAAGLGVAIIPESSAWSHHDVAVCRLKAGTRLFRDVGFAYDTRQPPGDAIVAALEEIRNSIARIAGSWTVSRRLPRTGKSTPKSGKRG
jgi:DNA-binding transcriptional LysR family regulator